jgi:hypothetical protein
MGKLTSLFSGTKSRQEMMRAEGDAFQKRQGLMGLDEDSEERKGIRKARASAMKRGGAASTRLSSDSTILGGAAPLG